MQITYNVSINDICDKIADALTRAGHAPSVVPVWDRAIRWEFDADFPATPDNPWRILTLKARVGKWDYECRVKCHPLTSQMGQRNRAPITIEYDDPAAIPPGPDDLNMIHGDQIFLDDEFASHVADHAFRQFIGCATDDHYVEPFPPVYITTPAEMDAPIEPHLFANDDGPGIQI